jgi:hypothetical protein
MNWTDIKGRWSQGWRTLQSQAMERYEAAIRKDLTPFEPTVRATVADLQATRAHLDHMGSLLQAGPASERDRVTYGRLLNRYQNLAAGIYADARPVTDEMGIAPIIIVAGLVLGVAAIAWGAAANKYTSNLREQTALADRELTARIEASQQGRTLPPSTLPDSGQGKGGGLGWLLVGGLAVAAGAVVVPVIWKKRGS